MDATPFVNRILEDEGLTSDLNEAEAMALNSSLLQRVRGIVGTAENEEAAWKQVDSLCRRGRNIARAFSAFRDGDVRTASEIARAGGLAWPQELPDNAELLFQSWLGEIGQES